VVRTVAGGMPGWQVAAVAAALVAAVAAVLVDRVLEARRRPLSTPA
jgi:membrane protein implicated in regulation of membrane protease activity